MNNDQFDSFVEDLISEKSERPLIIIATAKIDDLLLGILSKYLHPGNPKEKDDLLEGDQPLGTFSARIKLSYRLGLIDPSFYNILERIRKIRNLGAHRIIFSTRDSPIREHLHELKRAIKPRSSFKLTRSRYFSEGLPSDHDELQCLLVTIFVILEAIHDKIRTTTGNHTTFLISKK